MSKSFPYPSENPQPNALIIVLISAFASTLSILAFSTFRILPRIGRIAWNIRSLAVFAEPPAESPSTMKISHFDASRLSQLASFPLLSNEYFCFVSRLVFARSSVLRIFAAFSAHPITFLRVSRFRSKKRMISSFVTLLQAFAASGLSSFVLVCPSNLGSGCLMDTIAVIPLRISAPVKFASFSFKTPSSLAYWLIAVVNVVLNPVRCVPPSAL